MIAMKYTALVTMAATLLTFVFSGRVGMLRQKKHIDAPAVTGDPMFERAFRVHYNTIEQLVMFLPALWLATATLGDVYAAAVGAVWIVGRLLYSHAYMGDPDKRAPGMLTTLAATGVLSIAALWGIVKAFL